MKANTFGYGVKVITLTLSTNKLSYRLADQQRLGLPQGAEVVGFGTRCNQNFVSGVDNSLNNNPIIAQEVTKSLYLNIRGWSDKTILANVNLFEFNMFPSFLAGSSFQTGQNFIEPIPVERISWNRSTINISAEAAGSLVVNNTDVELFVFYRLHSSFENYPEATQIYPNGFETTAYKINSLEIPLRVAPNMFFPFTQDGKSSINDDAIIFGIKVISTDYTSETGRVKPNPQAFGSLFITLQAGRSNILENYPLRNLFAFPKTNLPYFPLEPVKAGAINWQESKLFLSDTSTDVTDTSVLLNFYYQEFC